MCLKSKIKKSIVIKIETVKLITHITTCAVDGIFSLSNLIMEIASWGHVTAHKPQPTHLS